MNGKNREHLQPEEQKASTQRYIGCLKMVSGSKMGGSLGGSEMGSTCSKRGMGGSMGGSGRVTLAECEDPPACLCAWASRVERWAWGVKWNRGGGGHTVKWNPS